MCIRDRHWGPPSLRWVRCLRASAVLSIGDMVTPGCRTLRDGDVSHEVVVVSSVPVLFAVRRVVDVAWVNLHDVLAARLHETDTFDDIESLTPVMEMPGRARTRSEVHSSNVELRGLAGLHEEVDEHVAGEPLFRTFDSWFPLLNSHDCSSSSQRSSAVSSARWAFGAVAQLASRSRASCEGLPGSAL